MFISPFVFRTVVLERSTLYENKMLHLMSAGASLKRFGEKSKNTVLKMNVFYLLKSLMYTYYRQHCSKVS